eukprot:m.1152779 g.1152779  ORF g.1152779 m.1152779 type:complete len:335 (-) comp24485_c0_seq12:761-1765(-)
MGFGNILILQMVLHPIIDKIWKGKSSNRVSKIVGVVIAFIAISVGMEVSTWERNYFQILGVSRVATTKQCRDAWKVQSKVLHPDVNPSPEAAQMFLQLGKIKEDIDTDDKRRVYDRFGERFFSDRDHQVYLTQPASMAFVHLPYYVSTVLLTYLITFDKARQKARTWAFLLLAAMLFCEVMCKYSDEDYDILLFLAPQQTVYEKFEVLKLVAVYIIHLMATYAQKTYVDIDEIRFMHVRAGQEIIIGALAQLENDLEEVLRKKRKGAEVADGGVPAVTSAKDGKEMQRRQKIIAMKQRAMQPTADMVPQQQQGTNWLQVIFTLLMIYSWMSGGK